MQRKPNHQRPDQKNKHKPKAKAKHLDPNFGSKSAKAFNKISQERKQNITATEVTNEN